MTTVSKSVFYDGMSSIPITINLFFDKNTGAFSFEYELKDIQNINEESIIKTKKSISWLTHKITFELRSSGLFLQHGEDPIQTIKITDDEMIKTINQFRKSSGQIGWYQSLIEKSFKFHIGISLIILTLIGLSYVYVLPWIAEKSVVLIPENYDNTLGDSFLEEEELFGTINVRKSKLLNDFSATLDLNNKKPLKFKVIDSDIMNAYALPNGTIVVYSGILNEMKSYEELVGLLAHEAAHVNNRHSMKMLCRNLSGYLFISTILGDVNGVMAVLGDNVNTLQSLSFSREFEKEADEDGFKIVTKNQVNPKGMVTLFQRLQKEQKFDMPEFLSTHPVTINRIEFVQKMIRSKNYSFRENHKLKMLFNEMKK